MANGSERSAVMARWPLAYVALGRGDLVDARRHLDEDQSVLGELEHGTFGDVPDLLALGEGLRVGALLYGAEALGVGFAGKADDESGADGDAGDAGADALDEIADVVAARLALHALEHRVADVLQRDVDVRAETLVVGEAGSGAGASGWAPPCMGLMPYSLYSAIVFC